MPIGRSSGVFGWIKKISESVGPPALPPTLGQSSLHPFLSFPNKGGEWSGGGLCGSPKEVALPPLAPSLARCRRAA